MAGLLFSFQRMFGPGTDFLPYRDGITVVESRMNLEDAGKDAPVHVIAVITNRTDLAWKDVQLDVRYFNQAGTLIDARAYEGSGTVLPHGEAAYRINTKPCHPLADYDSYKIFVRYARDVHTPF